MNKNQARRSEVKTRGKLGKIDRPFLLTLMILIGIGLLMVYSASMYSMTANGQTGYSQFLHQSFYILIGLVIMFTLSYFNYQNYLKKQIYVGFYVFTLILLILALIPGIGVSVNGARRWLSIGVTFQPSEIAKMAGVIYISATVTKHKELTNTPFGLNEGTKKLWLYCFVEIGLYFALIAVEPSLSASLAVGIAMFASLWYGGVYLKQFLPFFVGGGTALAFLLFADWRITRILSFFGQSDTNYQISQSLLAFGSGGLFGVGLGNGKQKLLFLPEIQNDFIFANIGEELGLVGCIVVLLLYFYLIYRGFQIGNHCSNKFGRLYTLSIMTLLGFQVFVNIGVATSTIPVTGMALPFISYGGTSIVILLAMIGPILNISRTVTLKKHSRNRNENTNGRRRNRRAYISRNRNIRSVKENIQ